jgi:uncharacterized protein (TIGR03435 family)
MRTFHAMSVTAALFTALVASAQAAPTQAAGTASSGNARSSAEKPLTFDTASVKPAGAPTTGAGRSGGSGAGANDPGRIHYAAVRLKDLLKDAYDVKDFQLAGPGWLDSRDATERFVIDATMPPDTTKEQRRMMFQNLLAERFKLKIHRETRELPVYALAVGKKGPRMKESAEAPPHKIDRDADAYGFPVSATQAQGRAGTWDWAMNGRSEVGGQQVTMQDLANQLADRLKSPVTDETALRAKYDYVLTFSSVGFNGLPPEGLEPLPDIFAAVQSQLGLKLVAKKGPVEVIVIDNIAKMPTEN